MKMLLAALLALVSAYRVAADVILVDWGPSATIVSSLRVGSAATGSTFSFSSPANPAVGPNYYTDPTGANPVFFSTIHNPNATTISLQIGNDFFPTTAPYTSDTIRINVSGGSAAGNTTTALVVWNRYGSGTPGSPVYGYQNGGDDSSQTVTLTSLSMEGNHNAGGGITNRFVIQLGSAFYISDPVGLFPVGNNPPGFGELSIPDVTTATWYNYDPLTDIRVIGSVATITDFSDVNAVGLYLTRNTALAATVLNISEFTAMGTVVPEPSSVALLLLGGGMALVLRRRARARS